MPRCADVTCGRWRPDGERFRWPGSVRLNGEWYCSEACVTSAARERLTRPAHGAPVPVPAPLPPPRLGALLRTMGAVTDSQISTAMVEQRSTGLRLGAQLQTLGYIGPEAVVRALAAQTNVRYLTACDLRQVEKAPGGLPARIVRALGLVPFEMDARQGRIHVLCTAPVPRAAVRALAKLTDWHVEPYLVHDAVFQEAMQRYRPQHADVPELTTVAGLEAAAAHVAGVASRQRDVTMRHAACDDDRVWVRVRGAAQVCDVLITGDREEEPCQAALTVH